MLAQTSAQVSHQLLDIISERTPNGDRIRQCLQCGTCSGICPNGFAMDYPPRAIIGALRAGDIEEVLNSDSIWLCVSCFACSQVCPAGIPVAESLMSVMKLQLMLGGRVPEELQSALENVRRYGNVLGSSPKKRAEWTSALDFEIPLMARQKRPVDVLWYVGDYASYHPSAIPIALAMARLFKALEIDFAILGPEENSHGDAQCVVAGEVGLSEQLALKNSRVFARYEFGEIVTVSPHAYNAFHNVYPRLGINYPVRHHTQFLAAHLDRLQPMLKQSLDARVTYHDPCCLGRAYGNEVYDEPRQLLDAIPGLRYVEMAHARDTSLCCGGGGGGMFLDGFSWEKTGSRLSEWRVAEAVKVQADVLAVSCPFEPSRFNDAIKTLRIQHGPQVKDIAELYVDAMGIAGRRR